MLGENVWQYLTSLCFPNKLVGEKCEQCQFCQVNWPELDRALLFIPCSLACRHISYREFFRNDIVTLDWIAAAIALKVGTDFLYLK